jgi:hypothetical protein
METEHRAIAALLALKDAPDDVLLDQVQAIGERAARHMLFDEAVRLQHTDRQTATDCVTLVGRIDALLPMADQQARAESWNSRGSAADRARTVRMPGS